MNERMILFTWHWGGVDGVLTGNVEHTIEHSQPWTFDRVKHCASNASTATFTASGGITISATDLGDSGDPDETLDDSGEPVLIDADESITFSLDFNGAAATAAEDVSITVQGFLGEGPQ